MILDTNTNLELLPKRREDGGLDVTLMRYDHYVGAVRISSIEHKAMERFDGKANTQYTVRKFMLKNLSRSRGFICQK